MCAVSKRSQNLCISIFAHFFSWLFHHHANTYIHVLASATMEQSNQQSNNDHNSSALVDFLKRRLWLMISLPYVVGILWTCAHPVISVVTGELKCRGWFIDENSLDAGYFRYNAMFQPPRKKSGITSMCQAMEQLTSTDDNIDCHNHKEYFEIAKLVPISNAITPASEAIVLVVPSSEDWLGSPYQSTMLQFMKRLATASASPWLAKTVLMVSPTASSNQTLAETVSSFLDAYLGTVHGSLAVATLPPSYTAAMIRNLLVLDVDVGTDKMGPPLNEVLLMPQGRRGVLPNMDLVFLVMTVYSSADFMDRRRYETNFVVHPHADASMKWRQWVSSNLPVSLQSWMTDLGDMALFARTLAVGPYAAHAPTLERGIDSLTLQVRFTARSARLEMQFIMEFVQRLEGIVRALSNLHERLHHSMTQYLMPSPLKFVSHSEYLIPNLLLLLPLVVRAVSLILWEIEAFDLNTLKVVAFTWSVALGIHEVSKYVDPMHLNVLFVAIYSSIPAVCRYMSAKQPSTHQSLHFLTCLAAIYCIIPLILGHVALAFPSALLWSPLIAMLSHRLGGMRLSIAMPLMLAVSWPPVLLLRIFGYYSPYMTLVHLPLHLLVCVLWQFKAILNRSNK
jgi:glycosylphosphatidylinositol transamidase